MRYNYDLAAWVPQKPEPQPRPAPVPVAPNPQQKGFDDCAKAVWRSQRGYVYLGGQLLVIQSEGVPKWVHADPVTKSQRLTDYNLIVVAAIDLDPWGGETNKSWGQGKQPHRYTSYERDGNGNDQAMNRQYHSYWQRFDQPDPFDGSASLADPQSFNRYSYCYNDPVNFVDPDGEIPILAMAVGAATSVATGWAIAKLTGQEYGWRDAAIDAGTGAAGTGIISKIRQLDRLATLRTMASRAGATSQSAQKGVEKYVGTNYLKVEIKHVGNIRNPTTGALNPQTSWVPRARVRTAAGTYIDPFTGAVGPLRSEVGHIPLELLPVTEAPLVGAATGAIRGVLRGERPDSFDERANALMLGRGRGGSAADQAFWNLGMMSMMFDRMRNTMNMGNLGTVTVYANGTSTYRGPLRAR